MRPAVIIMLKSTQSAQMPQSEKAIMEQYEKAIMETDQTSRKGQVKGTYPIIPDDLLKRAQSVQQRFADAIFEYATRETDQTSRKRQAWILPFPRSCKINIWIQRGFAFRIWF